MCWKLRFNIISFIILFLHSEINANGVPVITWNMKGSVHHPQPVPAFKHDGQSFTDVMQNIVNGNAKIIAFVMDKLSSEDFLKQDQPDASNSTTRHLKNFLETTPYTYMTVNDPLSQLHDLHCGVEEIYVADQNINKKVIQTAFAEPGSCVLILHITENGIFNSKNLKLEDFTNFLSPEEESVVGVFTAAVSSWKGSYSDYSHTSRKMLQAEAEADPHFVNINDCIYMYLNNATVTVGKGNSSIPLPLPPITEGSSCSNSSTSAVLQLTFKPSSDVTSVVVNFNFTKTIGSWITDVTITLSVKNVPEKELLTYSDFITASKDYSFNCGSLSLKTKNKTNVEVLMTGFQVQPFPTKDKKFDESFDCVGFFSIPIWMGVFISILFIVIINIGVYALFSVNTMDRFDDPKGKTISVGVSGD